MELIDSNISQWLQKSRILANQANLICITKNEFKTRDLNPIIWFGTNLSSFLAQDGKSEICPLFGKHINNADDFAYQLCRTIPWGFEMGRSLHAIYDVIINFTTQPQNRYFIWYDAQHLFRVNRPLFDSLFELLLVASYLNSNGSGTHDYQVNQKIIFLFDDTNEDEVKYLLSKSYYTPSVYDTRPNKADRYIMHEQKLVVIK